jgi:hypothetical protein
MNIDPTDPAEVAARAQGLEPLLAALDTDPRIDVVWLENTGGYCMAVVVPLTRRPGVIATINDADTWVVGIYEGGAWDDGSDGTMHTLDTMADLIDFIAANVDEA